MYEEFNRRIHDVIKDKIFLSNISGGGDEDGMDRFIAALERLMTIDEFAGFLKKWNKLNK